MNLEPDEGDLIIEIKTKKLYLVLEKRKYNKKVWGNIAKFRKMFKIMAPDGKTRWCRDTSITINFEPPDEP